MSEAVRVAGPGDAADLARLWAAAVEEKRDQRGGLLWLLREAPSDASVPPFPLDDTDPDVVALVGTWADAVVGAGLARVETVRDGSRLARIEVLYVEPGARGVGVGEALIGALLDWAGARGCAAIDAVALPGDRQTKNFFETAGLVARAITVSRRLEA